MLRPGTETALAEGLRAEGLRVHLQPLGNTAACEDEASRGSHPPPGLSAAELARGTAMAPAARSAFIARRLAQLAFVAGLLGVPPSSLTPFYDCPACGAGTETAHGRPGYLHDGVPAPLLLSASHAEGWLLLAAVVDPSPGLVLGADLEGRERTAFAGFDSIALTAMERESISRLPDGARALARARLWARKEAWLKMTGQGLRTPPDSIDVLDRLGLHDLDLPYSVQGEPVPAGLVGAVGLAPWPRQ